MTVTLIYKCRLCGGWERLEKLVDDAGSAGILRLRREYETALHPCSGKMTGVADFAGIEMVEEEETGC
jgi:hypothetical protein